MSFGYARFGATVKAALLTRHLSLREAAKETGVSVATLSRIANGGAPDMDNFAALVRWLGIDANEMLDSVPSVNERNGGWLALCLGLSALDVPDEVSAAIITIVRTILGEV